MHKNREGFGSKIGIIAAAAGSAVGLGNIYRFPCEAGYNGGGAFLLVYLLIVLVLGIPTMLSEFIIGRKAQRNPVGAFRVLAPESAWPLAGFMGVFCAWILLSFYSTVSGWTLEYIIKAAGNDFQGKELAAIEQDFSDFHNLGWRNVLWQSIFIFLTGFVVFNGVKKGIERYSKILMPLLLLILIILGVKSLSLPNAGEGIRFLFRPDFSKITGKVLISALGQAFFSLSVGMGALITYGSYIKKNDNLATTALSVTLSDTLVAILAGIVIFPAAFSFGIQPTAGIGLVFNTLPMIFNQMQGGYFFCIIFFVLLAIAALTSTISLLEVIVVYVVEELHLSRKLATVLASVATLALGVSATLSLTDDTRFIIGGRPLFDGLDFFSSNILLPLGGLLIVVFVGWFMGKKKYFDEITNEGQIKVKMKGVILFIIKYIAPVLIAAIFINCIR
ncbi:MAG: sodium-dependent transporter [Candidatus Limimorpha sp.]